MDTKDVILKLRTESGMSQEELAGKVFVTRQAVSRWENGETVPNTDTLKLLSELFGVSINTLLGAGEKLICQCCGMPLESEMFSREKDGTPNSSYCKWCYAGGQYMYSSMDDLIEVCVKNMAGEEHPESEVRAYLKEMLPQLDYWKRYKELGDDGKFEEFKKKLVDEINALGIEGMPKVNKLNALVGAYVNLEFQLPSGMKARFLDDRTTYLGNQLETALDDGRCFGVLANMDFILICTYGTEGADPELVLYKKR